jgi:hypothetical protein
VSGLLTGALVPYAIAKVGPFFARPLVVAGSVGAAWIAVGFLVVAVAADVFGLRPLAVHRQVPSLWGHQRGPWLAALRYGPRLGLGPATILTSWTWWSAMICALTAGALTVLGAGAVYVIVRALSIIWVGSGVTNGVEMAKRMAKVASATRRNRITLAAIALSLGGAVVVAVAAVATVAGS